MNPSLSKLLCVLGIATLLGVAGALALPHSASAAPHPSFRVVCYPTGIAPNDPIVFPGQYGRSHSHTFYGAKDVDENTTVDTLMRQPSSQCGSHYDAVDLSGYWIPTLMQHGEPVYTESGKHQLVVYYQRAGGPDGAPVAQAMPRGLELIAGDMHATTPQNHVTYACANERDTGRQHGGDHTFVTCASDEVLIAKLVFPDCWDGRNLKSADHRSHVAYSQGARSTCPSSHPVKLPQITFEAWYFGVNGPAASFSWASGGAYTFHGDVMSAWDADAAANLVNQCINVAFDCNPYVYPDIPRGPVSLAQIDAQLVAGAPLPEPPTEANGDHEDHAEHQDEHAEHPDEHAEHTQSSSPSSATPSPSDAATPSGTPSSATAAATAATTHDASTSDAPAMAHEMPRANAVDPAGATASDEPASALPASLLWIALLAVIVAAGWTGIRRFRSLRR